MNEIDITEYMQSEELAEDLKSLLDLMDKTPVIRGKSTSAIEDENGVVHLLDENGNTTIFMAKQDYLDILDYIKERNI
jgi:hypothetical protein